MADKMGSPEEELRAENVRLVTEMNSMKKKIMVAMKKQQTELQARIQAAEERAAAAEAALGLVLKGDQQKTRGSELSPLIRPESASGEVASYSSHGMETRIDEDLTLDIQKLTEELSEERRRRMVLEESHAKERDLMQEEISKLQRLLAVEESRSQCGATHYEEKKEEATGDPSLTIFQKQNEMLTEQLREKTFLVETLRTELSSLQKDSEAKIMATKKKCEPQLVGRLENEDLRTDQFVANEISEIMPDCMLGSDGSIRTLDDSNQHMVEVIKHEIADIPVAENESEASILGLAEECRKLKHQINEKEEKLVELDAKFSRLQKRAKQRIQDVQKEKEEVEVQLLAANEKITQMLSRQSSLQDELDRFRANTTEAIRSLDGERQALRNHILKLEEEIRELTHSIDINENNLAESQRLASAKDQMVLDLTSKLKEAEMQYEASTTEVTERNAKMIKSLQFQLADAVTERNNLTEAMSALQTQLVVGESNLTKLHASFNEETAGLRAALEAAKGDFFRLDEQYRNEKSIWEAAIVSLKDRSEAKAMAHAQEISSLKEANCRLEAELEAQYQSLNAAQADVDAARREAAQLREDFAAYKVRAHALLQRKDAEILAAKDAGLAAAQDLALKEAQRQAQSATIDREKALAALQKAKSESDAQLVARTLALSDAEQKIRDLAANLESVNCMLSLKDDDWKKKTEELEAFWDGKCKELESRLSSFNDGSAMDDYTMLQHSHDKLKMEHNSFREMVDSILEEKEKQIARLLNDVNNLQKTTAQPEQIQTEEETRHAREPNSDAVAAAEHQILTLARKQAQREEEVKLCLRQIEVLQEEISELEHENRLHSQQEAVLKEELRKMERAIKRDGIDMTYLKNVIVKLLETGEVEVLLPVISTLLQFSPEELQRCQEVYNGSGLDTPLSGAAAVVDVAALAPRTLLSRISFGN